MEEKIKQRIIGILVLVGSLFIILPFLFHNSRPSAEQQTAVAAVPNATTPPAVSVTLPAENNAAPNNNATAINTQAAQPVAAVIPSTAAVAPAVQTRPAQPAQQQPAVIDQKSQAVAQALPKAAPKPTVVATNEKLNSNTVAFHTDASGFKPDRAVSPTSGLTGGAPISAPTANQVIPDESQAFNKAQAMAAQAQPTVDESMPQHKMAHHHAHASKSAHHVTHARNGKEWEIQLAVFANEHNAKKLMAKLHARHFAAHTRRIVHHGRHMVAVYVGPEYSHQKTLALQHHLHRELHMSGVVKKA